VGFFDFLKQEPQKPVPVKQPKRIEDVVSDDPEIRRLQRELKSQDEQLEKIKRAESYFKETGDIDFLIKFWEGIWKSGGLLFSGSKWTFRLPDLYIKIGEYDKALTILKKIKNPYYIEKRDSYINRVKTLKSRKKKL
jgi:tetratricopeptide (TPR) repeat protein